MRDDSARLLDILLACRAARRFAEGISRDEFMADEKTQASVCLKLEIVGEAARVVSNTFKKAHLDIPWRDIIEMRHRVVHEYFRLDLEVIWEILQEDVPDLIRLIEPLVPPEDRAR